MKIIDVAIILSHTSHPGNIGAVARAMKNMGLSQLILVSPKEFPHVQAINRASGADDILDKAKVVKSLEEAITDFHWVLGTSARSREFPWPQVAPVEAASKIQAFLHASQKVAVVFGNEQSGLSNEELHYCDYHVAIPTAPDFASLNIACAVQIMVYEIYQRLSKEFISIDLTPHEDKATKQEVLGLLTHFEKIAVATGFLDPAHPKKLFPRIKRLLTKAQLEKEEINILRGFLKKVSPLNLD